MLGPVHPSKNTQKIEVAQGKNKRKKNRGFEEELLLLEEKKIKEKSFAEENTWAVLLNDQESEDEEEREEDVEVEVEAEVEEVPPPPPLPPDWAAKEVNLEQAGGERRVRNPKKTSTKERSKKGRIEDEFIMVEEKEIQLHKRIQSLMKEEMEKVKEEEADATIDDLKQQMQAKIEAAKNKKKKKGKVMEQEEKIEEKSNGKPEYTSFSEPAPPPPLPKKNKPPIRIPPAKAYAEEARNVPRLSSEAPPPPPPPEEEEDTPSSPSEALPPPPPPPPPPPQDPASDSSDHEPPKPSRTNFVSQATSNSQGRKGAGTFVNNFSNFVWGKVKGMRQTNDGENDDDDEEDEIPQKKKEDYQKKDEEEEDDLEDLVELSEEDEEITNLRDDVDLRASYLDELY